MSRHYIPPRGSSDGCNVVQSLLLDVMPVPCRGIFQVRKRGGPGGRTTHCSGLIVGRIPIRGRFPMFSMILLKTNGSKRASSVFPKRRRLLSASRVCRTGFGPGGNRGEVTLAKLPVLGTQEVVFLVAKEIGDPIMRSVFCSKSAKPTTCVTRRTSGIRLFVSGTTTRGIVHEWRVGGASSLREPSIFHSV